jgi:ferredoxin
VAIAFIVALLVAVGLAALGTRAAVRKASGRSRPFARPWPPLRQCPVCGTALLPGQRVQTAKFPSRAGVATVHLAGCPHCLGSGTAARVCPICARTLAESDYLLGRMWQQADTLAVRRPGEPAAMHIRVNACNHCVTGQLR